MSEPEPKPEEAVPQGPSNPHVAVLAIFAVLVVVGYHGKDSWWGVIPHLLALGGLAWGAHDSLSRKCFEHIQKQYPRETRSHYRLNTLLCYVVFPGMFWVIFGFPMLYHWLKR